MLWMLTDSQSAITYLKGGPNAPLTTVGDNIWKLMKDIKSHGTSINFQWVPGHRDIAGNEEADQAAGEANTLPQNEVPVDFATIKAALKRKTWDEWIGSDELKSTFSYKITSGRPKGTASLSRELEDEVIINQLRTGKSALSRKCPTRYKGMTPEHAKCLECGEEESVAHLLTCPVKGGIRRSITHNGRQ